MTESKQLQLEANKTNYRLRSVFFYMKLHEYKTLEFPGTINSLLPHADLYDWNHSDKWGISTKAYNSIVSSNLKLIQVFAHPKLLREYPHLIAYYRNVAVLSQKAISYLSGVGIDKFESKLRTNLSETQALAVGGLCNEHISLIIENALGELSDEIIKGLLFASTGSQIDGSWRNAIGGEAEKIVQLMLTQEAHQRNLIDAFIFRTNGSIIPISESNMEIVMKDIKSLKGLMFKNKTSILFSSEPDITLVDKDGASILVVEVKGGLDPAGALERYGAAKKSFSNELKENNQVKTCLVAACITTEVEDRIEFDETISAYFNLSKIVGDERIRNAFLDYVFQFVIG